MTPDEITELADFLGADVIVEVPEGMSPLDFYRQRRAELHIGRPAAPRPEVVCLCGSTRFPEAWAKARYDLTLDGKIVLTIGCDTKSDEGLGITVEQKVMLDELHKRKIDMADRVLVLNVDGYIGDSTRSEIAYARAHRVPVDFLESHAVNAGVDDAIREWICEPCGKPIGDEESHWTHASWCAARKPVGPDDDPDLTEAEICNCGTVPVHEACCITCADES